MWVMTAALVAALSGPAAGFQSPSSTPSARPARPPETDETVAVTRGVRLSLSNFAGDVIVRAWDRDAVRVRARHSPRARVTVQSGAASLIISASGSQGPPGTVDYEISVPAWMPVNIDGAYAFISIEGTQGEVAAETVRGDISVKGGTAVVTARSVEGEVILEGARGKITANSVNRGVTITGASGSVVAETVNGPIALTGIESDSVDVASINGHIKYDGIAAANGSYRFTTHNGNISVAIPESAGATFTVRTYNGRVSTNLPLRGGPAGRGRRSIYTQGNGSAGFKLESFGGTIQLRPGGAEPGAVRKLKDL